MPTSRRGRGTGPSSVSRGRRCAPSGRASRTRRSSMLHGGDDVTASGSRYKDNSEPLSTGNALIALSLAVAGQRRLGLLHRPRLSPRSEQPGRSSFVQAQEVVRSSPEKMGPGILKTSRRSNEPTTPTSGGGVPRSLIEHPQVMHGWGKSLSCGVGDDWVFVSRWADHMTTATGRRSPRRKETQVRGHTSTISMV